MTTLTKCAACAEEDMKDLGQIPDGELYQCRVCGSYYLDTDAGAVSVETQSYGAAYRKGHDKTKTAKLYEIFCGVTSGMNGQARTLLDVGCGDGGFMEVAAHEGWKVCGVDSDTDSIEIAKGRSLTTHHGTLGESLSQFGKFSVITLWDVIEHIPDVEAAMQWLANSVAPDGKLILLTPDADSILDSIAHLERTVTRHKSQRMMNLCLNRYHRRRFTQRGLTQLVSRFGFVPEQVNTLQLFSLSPERYLSGFAPGVSGWTTHQSINNFLSRTAYGMAKMFGVKNKFLLTCHKSASVSRSDG